MVLTLAVNVVLATIVFAVVVALIMRAIRSSTAPAVTAAEPRAARQPVTRRRARSLVPARPWA